MDFDNFILASTSPRREQLLNESGYNFKVVAPSVDESAFSTNGVDCREYAEKLALAKAKSVGSSYGDNLIVGADTIAEVNGQIIGKAVDEKHARQITIELFGSPHRVITGVALYCEDRGIELVRSDVTIIYPKRLTEAQVNKHIESNLWRGKAGAYAIKENGDEYIERIEGSLSNVMGLPMELLRRMFEEVNIGGGPNR